jgi:hypothetical protein
LFLTIGSFFLILVTLFYRDEFGQGKSVMKVDRDWMFEALVLGLRGFIILSDLEVGTRGLNPSCDFEHIERYVKQIPLEVPFSYILNISRLDFNIKGRTFIYRSDNMLSGVPDNLLKNAI